MHEADIKGIVPAGLILKAGDKTIQAGQGYTQEQFDGGDWHVAEGYEFFGECTKHSSGDVITREAYAASASFAAAGFAYEVMGPDQTRYFEGFIPKTVLGLGRMVKS